MKTREEIREKAVETLFSVCDMPDDGARSAPIARVQAAKVLLEATSGEEVGKLAPAAQMMNLDELKLYIEAKRVQLETLRMRVAEAEAAQATKQ